MKKIINGAKYDTNTARKLGNWWNRLSDSDFRNCEETLYRTKSGKYFLHGEGGAMTKYAQSAGNNSWSGGSNIEPVSRATAMAWAEEHLGVDEYEDIFGEVDEGTEQLNITIPAALKAKLWELGERRGTSISAIAEEVLSKLVE